MFSPFVAITITTWITPIGEKKQGNYANHRQGDGMAIIDMCMEVRLLNRGLIKRLEKLETRFVPVTSGPRLLQVQYVDSNGNVVETRTYDMRPPWARSSGVQREQTNIR